MAKEPLQIIWFSEPLASDLGRAVAAGADLTQPMKEIADHLEAVVARRFETGTGPAGKAWKPSQRVREHGGQTLVLIGDLRSAVHADSGKNYAEIGVERSFGAAVYARIHQFGGVIKPRTKKALSFGGRVFAQVVMPARPYLGFDEQDRLEIETILGGFLHKLLPGQSGKGATS